MATLPIRAENLAHLREQHGLLLHWLLRHALPLWETHGVDREAGGYFESIAFDPARQALEPRGEIRRGRVVARQMFVFHTGRALGWEPSGPDPLRHGCDYLFSHMRRNDGHFHTAIEAATRAPQGGFSLYESAFYLFALAKVHGTLSDRYPIHESALTFLKLLREGWGKPNGGFEESRPASLPLKSNPHMHLLEAALAWIDATAEMPAQQTSWVRLADELAELCLCKFIDPRTGAVREFFDEWWFSMPDASGRIVEPGHQFEWAWLLMQWADGAHCPVGGREECRRSARQLAQLGEQFGVDPVRGVAINEIWDDMTPKDVSAKLWPQTERIKAWCAIAKGSTTREEENSAFRNLSNAILGLQRFLDTKPLGLWQEVLSVDGRFSREPSKASSFYHIVSAFEVFDRCLKDFSTT